MFKLLHYNNIIKIDNCEYNLIHKLNIFKRINFFLINVVGRIFRWIKYINYMQFLLPISNKPFLIFNNDYFVIAKKNKPIFYITISYISNFQIIKKLHCIKKPSIFNKRGFRTFNRLFYKKKGKITTYITNK